MPSIPDLLVMATHLHGLVDSQLNGDLPLKVNGFRIIKQALMWIGEWTAARYDMLRGGPYDPLIATLYQTLVELSQERGSNHLIVGFGNLHEESKLRADPMYVSFGATVPGREHAIRLLAKYECLSPYSAAELGVRPVR